MKKNEKRMILILLLILIIAIIIFIVNKNKKEDNKEENINKNNITTEEFVEVLEDGTKANTSKELKRPKEIEGLEITNIQLTEKEGQTVLLANVTNSTEKDTEVIGINIVILDKKGEEIAKIPGAIPPLKTRETKQLNIGITEDYANAYNFRVEKQ